MKDSEDFNTIVQKLILKNQKYKKEAYYFTMSALDYTLNKLDKPRHVSGKELLHGIKKFGYKQFGSLCLTVLKHWGITKTEDFGKIVFILIEAGIMSKTDEDTLEDFRDVFNLDEALGNEHRIKIDKNRIRKFSF